MDKLYSPVTIRDIQKRYGFHFSKSLGQNFLVDGNIVDKIIQGADVGPEDLVIEVGPGAGVLTDAACCEAGWVTAVEIDSSLIPVLKETLAAHENLTIVNADILKSNIREIIDEARSQMGKPDACVKVIGNLPYYITTPIIMKILEEKAPVESITIMLQKEVADRIRSGPGSKAYGAISAAVQYYCTVEVVTTVPKEVFIPRPKVDSAVIRLNIRKEKPVEVVDEKMFFNVIKSSFGQRRKTLANSITGVSGMKKEESEKALKAAGIDPKRRAETLALEEFAAIANAISKTKENKDL